MTPRPLPHPALLALTPPRSSPIALAGQVEMVAALAGVRRATRQGVALEVVGEGGYARFLARAANAAARDQLAMFFAGYFPQGTITSVDDPADDPARLCAGEAGLAAELRLRSAAALPVRALVLDETSAQLLRVVGVLRSLPAGTRGVCQLILWPAPRRWGANGRRWLQGERARLSQRPREEAGPPPKAMAALALLALVGVAGYHYVHIHDIAHLVGLGGAALGLGGLALARATVLAPDPPPDPDLVERKLAAPAFTARLRLLVAGGDAESQRRGLDALVAAYAAYEEPRGNGFVARPCAPRHVVAITARGGPRLWRRPWPILNAAEVASLYHLPLAEVDVPGLARAGPRALLPTTEALKTGTPIGTATVGAHSEPVCIPHAAHAANVVVLGATGTGKSTFLQIYTRNAVELAGVQLIVVDPDSALVTDMVGWLPDHQKLRAVVVDFGHPTYAVGVNLLDAHTGRRTDQIIDSLVQAWARFYEEAWGPRLEDLIRYACATILAANRTRPRDRQLTLLDIKPLVQIGAFRDSVVREADDVRLTAYWRDDYLGMPRTERLNAIKPVLTRINRFLLNDAAHAIVGQPASTIDIPRLLETGAPLFIDAAAHRIGEETAALLDAVLLNVIHDAVCERRDRDRQVLIVVDEFQHAPALWDEYLPRIRKYRGSYVLAAQGIATVDRVQRDLHKVVVGNCGTDVVFRNPDPDEAAYLAGVLDNAVAPEDVQTLGLRQCYIKTSDAGGPLPVVSATLPLPPLSNGGTARLIAAACARRYGRPIAGVLAARDHWMTDLYYAANEERKRDPDNAGGTPDATTPTPVRETTSAGIDETTRKRDETPMEPGSQPTLGLPVTRINTRDGGRSRRTRRRNRLPLPSPDASSNPNPSPRPVVPVPGAQQLPLCLDSDTM